MLMQKDQPMKWEYLTCDGDDEELNKLGQDGWEIAWVHVTVEPGYGGMTWNQRHVLLKRPIHTEEGGK